MKTQEKILEILQNKENEWVSGENLGSSLNITRAAIWKNVMKLRNEGFVIDAVRNKGYRFVDKADVLSEFGVLKYLEPDCRMLDIHVLPSVGSTNEMLWEKAKDGAAEGTVLIAAMQTDGRGQRGRRFYSPAETGIYLSILLRPRIYQPDFVSWLTGMAAVAACETFEALADTQTFIKWLNDVFMNGRKVSGILTEVSYDQESGFLKAAVLGIGINAYIPEDGFPAEIEKTAGAVFDQRQSDGKNKLAAGFLNCLMKNYLISDFDSFVQEYKKRCFVIGKKIMVYKDGKIRRAEAIDVDDCCRLIVEYEDGSIGELKDEEIRPDE